MKVSESKGKCDFCYIYDAEYGINDNLWWICAACMNSVYGDCHCTEDLIVHHMSPCKMINPPSKFIQGEEE